jgi:hypothetical protein
MTIGSKTAAGHVAAGTDGQVDPSEIMQLGMAFWASKTLLSAVELELITMLGGDAMTAAEIAEALGLHERAAPDFLGGGQALRDELGHASLARGEAVGIGDESGELGCARLVERDGGGQARPIEQHRPVAVRARAVAVTPLCPPAIARAARATAVTTSGAGGLESPVVGDAWRCAPVV